MGLEQFNGFDSFGLRGFIQVVKKVFDRRISSGSSEEFNGKGHKFSISLWLFCKGGNALDHTVGGHVKKGENYGEAASREAEEEIGLTEKLTRISVFYSDETWGGSNIRHMIGLYECKPSDWTFRFG